MLLLLDIGFGRSNHAIAAHINSIKHHHSSFLHNSLLTLMKNADCPIPRRCKKARYFSCLLLPFLEIIPAILRRFILARGVLLPADFW